MSFNRHHLVFLLFAGFTLNLVPYVQAQDPLPSWNSGATKMAIVDFVNRVTTPGSPDFVPLEDRSATFDNDGCLWSEQPMPVELAFAIDRVRALAPDHPEWQSQQPFKAVLENDLDAVVKSGMEGLMTMVLASHAGMTTDEFSALVRNWLNTARHPRFKRRYSDLVFQPMLELLAYLRANGFKTYITTGGEIEFLRVFAADVYGIPPEQVIGSSSKTKFQIRDGQPVLVMSPEIDLIDEKVGKPVGFHRHIGRRPLAAFGNFDDDLQMLQWTAAGKGPRFCLLVHHTDAEREWQYDRDSHIGRLDKALVEAREKSWTVVNMQRDWKVIYPFQKNEHYYFHKVEQSHAAHWSYSGDTGPEYWGELDPSYIMASRGRHQSPVDIRAVAETQLPEVIFDYKPSRIRLVYNGHTVQESEDAGSVATGPLREFQLEQFHFHSPSEHTVNGHQFPMEMHLVHKTENGEVGVVAVLIKSGKHNPQFDPVWNYLPSAEVPNRDSATRINAGNLLPISRRYYYYQGSFTTPPCTEHVEWMVMAEPIELSDEQISRFRMIIDGNNRPIQPLNGRVIEVSR